YGIFPWISLALAVTFALYGLLKKLANIEASFSLAIETMIITPITLIYLFSMHGATIGFTSGAMNYNLLLLFYCIGTAVLLFLFCFWHCHRCIFTFIWLCCITHTIFYARIFTVYCTDYHVVHWCFFVRRSVY